MTYPPPENSGRSAAELPATRAGRPTSAGENGFLWDAARAVTVPVFPGGAIERMVFLVVARHADKKGVCWPSISRIAAESGLSVNGVVRPIQHLRDIGLLSWVPRPGRSNLYHLDRPTLVAILLAPPTRSTPVADEGPLDDEEPPHDVGGATSVSNSDPHTTCGTPPHDVGEPPRDVWDTSPRRVCEVAKEVVQEVAKKVAKEGGAVAESAPAPATPQVDDTGAPLLTWNGSAPPVPSAGVVCWIQLKRVGLFVGVTEERVAELQADFPLVDVRREFIRPEGIRDWNAGTTPRKRKQPGTKGCWRHVRIWLDGEQKRAEQAARRAFAASAKAMGQVVPGTVCGCGGAKAEGAASCPRCADEFASYARDSLSRERRSGAPTARQPAVARSEDDVDPDLCAACHHPRTVHGDTDRRGCMAIRCSCEGLVLPQTSLLDPVAGQVAAAAAQSNGSALENPESRRPDGPAS